MTLLQVVVFLNHLHQADCDARWRYSSTNSLTATLDLTRTDDDLTTTGPQWGAGPLLCSFTLLDDL